MTVSFITWQVSTGCSRHIVVWREGDLWPRYEHVMTRATANWLRYWCFEPRLRIDQSGSPIVFFADSWGTKAGYVWNCATGMAGWIEEPDWIYPSTPMIPLVPIIREWMERT